jgi:hypothetical protein
MAQRAPIKVDVFNDGHRQELGAESGIALKKGLSKDDPACPSQSNHDQAKGWRSNAAVTRRAHDHAGKLRPGERRSGH